MKNLGPNPADASLRSALRAAQPAPALPPRFEEQVWRRIERADQLTERQPITAGWLLALVPSLRPAWILAVVTLLIVAGAGLGAHQAYESTRQDAQARYVASVSPNPLR